MSTKKGGTVKTMLNQELKDWRKKTADEIMKPIYMVLSNKVMDVVSVRKPASMRELGEIAGFGPVKLKTYGPSIVQIVLKHTENISEQDAVLMGVSDLEYVNQLLADTPKRTKTSKAKTDKKRNEENEMSPIAIANMDCSKEINLRELNSEQQAAASRALSTSNVFITGSAGTGKTFLLKYVIQELVARHGESGVAVTAPTGISALAVGGQTIHSFAGIGLGTMLLRVMLDMN